MRIGNIEDMEKTKKSPEPEIPEPGEMTKGKKWKNWWYYHKWYVIIGLILFLIACNLIGNALGLFQKSPNLQIAYVGKSPLSPDTAAAIQKAFTSLAADYNHDGEILIQVNQYVDGNDNMDADTAYYQYASEITLIGDISNCESYFFLLEDPVDFQRRRKLSGSVGL